VWMCRTPFAHAVAAMRASSARFPDVPCRIVAAPVGSALP
jgi:hypothetical protein